MRKIFFIVGMASLVSGIAGFFIAASLFTATNELPWWLDRLGLVSFYGWMPMLGLGALCLLAALMLTKRK